MLLSGGWMPRMSCKTATPPGGGIPAWLQPGVSLKLNPRLMAGNPLGCSYCVTSVIDYSELVRTVTRLPV